MPSSKPIVATLCFLLLLPLPAEAQSSADVVCFFAPSQNEQVRRATNGLKGVIYTTEASLAISGLHVVTHSSGGSILLGPGGYIAGTFAAPRAREGLNKFTDNAVMG